MRGATQKGGGRGSSAGGDDTHSQPFTKSNLLLKSRQIIATIDRFDQLPVSMFITACSQRSGSAGTLINPRSLYVGMTSHRRGSFTT